ncbi:MAG TPA: glycosyltransferase [Verrucomicrobiota bacterium]|nr:glycosyltransferase [Verrucomicrobiota bacterium]HNU49833.1 glycosyltransferase [Verrucomicrobiota bacterium]
MRLAFLTHEPFYPPSGGGSAEGLYLVRELVGRGHAVEVFCPAIADPQRVAADLGVRLRLFRGWRMGRYTSLRSVKYLLFPRALETLVARAARSTRYDLILSQHAIASVAAGWLKRRLQLPVVMNQLDFLTGFMDTWPRWRMPRTLLTLLQRYELSLPRRCDANGVLTVSQPLADRIVAAGFPRERVQAIYYGYDAGLFAWNEPAARPVAPAPPVVVMHGSFDHHHLGRIALGAIAAVRRVRPETRFRFVGQATIALGRFLAELDRHGLGDGIERTGFVPYADVAGALADATVGVVPYEESAGTHCAFVAKVVEYLGLGIPTVCTPLEGVRTYFAKEPLARFSRFDGADFGARIVDWLETPAVERVRLGRAAAERVKRELDWRVICRRAADRIERVAAEASPTNRH